MSSLYYNHPFWPSPRAARIAKLVLKKYGSVKPAGRLTHDKALKVMADNLGLTVHEFLHIKPVDAILRLKVAYTEAQAYRILGNTTLPAWWMSGVRMPCCVACERTAPCRETTAASTTHAAPAPAPAPEALAAPPEPATVVPVRDPPAPAILPALSAAPTPCRETTAASTTQAPASGELIETLMEFLKEMNGGVTAGDLRYVTAMIQRFKGRVV